MDNQDKIMVFGCVITLAYIAFILSLVGFAIWVIVKVLLHFGIV